MLPTLLSMASLFSRRYADYANVTFPATHGGVDSNVFPQLDAPFDFVVVGSGYAGAYLAGQLARSGCQQRVLLLEAGAVPAFDSAIPFAPIHDRAKTEWNYYSVPQRQSSKSLKDMKVRLAAGRALGGDSLVSEGLDTPPNFADFHRWSYLYDLHGWSYTDMKKHAVKMNRTKATEKEGAAKASRLRNMPDREIMAALVRPDFEHDLMDPLKAAWLKAGHTLNYSTVTGKERSIFHQGGFFIPQTMSTSGMKMNPAAEFLVGTEKNLVIITNAEVRTLLYTPDGRRVVGLEFEDTLMRNVYHVNVRREVLLAAGAIGSARILMQSGIGPSDLLRSQGVPVLRDLPVGARLNDRVSLNFYLDMRSDFMNGLKRQLNDPAELYAFLEHGEGMLTNSSTCGCAMIKSGANTRATDILLEMKPVGIVEPYDFMNDVNYDDSVIKKLDRRGNAFRDGNLQLTATLVRPYSQGTMWLWRRADGAYQPRMNPSYLTDKRDLEALVSAARSVERLVESPFLEAVGAHLMYPQFDGCPPPVLPATDAYWRCVVGQLTSSGRHVTSTAPLGSVVDSRLRVNGVGGLRVVDQSVLPETATGGLPATILAVANKAYSMLVADNNLRC